MVPQLGTPPFCWETSTPTWTATVLLVRVWLWETSSLTWTWAVLQSWTSVLVTEVKSQRSMIDFVVVSSDLQPSVLDINLKRGAGHSRVTCWIPWQWQELETPGRAKCVVRVCWECLLEPSVRKVYNSHLSEHFDHIPREAGDIHSKWTMTCWSSCSQLEGILSSIVVLGVSCGSWWIPAAQASSSFIFDCILIMNDSGA